MCLHGGPIRSESEARGRRGAGRSSGRRIWRETWLAGLLEDAFDFFLVVMCPHAIGREFPQGPKGKWPWCNFVTLLFRPVGRIHFRPQADRWGRAAARLMLEPGFLLHRRSVVRARAQFHHLPGAARAVTARHGRRVGAWAPRWPWKKVPPRLRGLLSGFLQQGYATG